MRIDPIHFRQHAGQWRPLRHVEDGRRRMVRPERYIHRKNCQRDECSANRTFHQVLLGIWAAVYHGARLSEQSRLGRMKRHSEMLVGEPGCDTPARRTLQEADLEKVWLVDV